MVSYSNETVKLDSKYTLKVKTDNGRVLGLSVIDGHTVKKEGIDQIVDVGSRISFPTGNINSRPRYTKKEISRGETWFRPETQVGTKRADRIKVLMF